MQTILCEYASVHADGTFTVVRGAVETWTVPALPSTLNAFLLVTTEPELFSPGQWMLKVQAKMPNGMEVMIGEAPIRLDPKPGKTKSGVRMAIMAQMLITEAGRIKVSVSLGDHSAAVEFVVQNATGGKAP
jgi:hypothetical protein